MNSAPPARVEPMTRVTFDLATAAGPADPFPVANTHAAIVGIGSAGMTPFETLLLGKAIGETVSANVSPESLPAFFGHLPIRPPVVPDSAETITLIVSIRDIARPDARETIRAMAALAEGCGGGCDCGCGGH